MNPADLRYSKEHEWVESGADAVVTVGITHFAQDSLGDVVFVELPGVGSDVGQFEKMGEIESVKAVSDLFSPVSGKVVGRNENLIDHPELVNESPFENGWMLKIELSNASELDGLLNAGGYESFLASDAS
jgi:glycine cleavage system H protein